MDETGGYCYDDGFARKTNDSVVWFNVDGCSPNNRKDNKYCLYFNAIN